MWVAASVGERQRKAMSNASWRGGMRKWEERCGGIGLDVPEASGGRLMLMEGEDGGMASFLVVRARFS